MERERDELEEKRSKNYIADEIDAIVKAYFRELYYYYSYTDMLFSAPVLLQAYLQRKLYLLIRAG